MVSIRCAYIYDWLHPAIWKSHNPAPVETATLLGRIDMKKRHYAQVALFRIETAFIEFDVDEDDTDAAEKLAEEKAKQLASAEWRPEPFDSEDQAPFVMSITDETEAEELCADPYELVDASSVTRFILLSGNLDTGEGEVIAQPWLSVDLPDLLISDIAHDWIEKLEALGLTGLSDRLDELREGSQPQPSDLVRFGAATKRKKLPPSISD